MSKKSKQEPIEIDEEEIEIEEIEIELLESQLAELEKQQLESNKKMRIETEELRKAFEKFDKRQDKIHNIIVEAFSYINEAQSIFTNLLQEKQLSVDPTKLRIKNWFIDVDDFYANLANILK